MSQNNELIVEVAVRVGELAETRARLRDTVKSRDEAWARVASAEESERKAMVVAADFAGAVEAAIKSEREACAKVVEAMASTDGTDDDLLRVAAAIRARKP